MTTFIDSGLDGDERVIIETAAGFATKRLAPFALEWEQSAVALGSMTLAFRRPAWTRLRSSRS